MKQLSPVLIVDSVEPCLPFWADKLGFETVATVNEGDAMGFAMLSRGGVTVMYQSRTSVEKDMGDSLKNVPEFAAGRIGPSFLYITVEDIDDVERRLAGVPVVMPRRKAFYGATEITYREPGGNIVCFGQHE